MYTLICDDFLSLHERHDEQYDVIVTSPPYNIGIEYDEYSDYLEEVDFLRFLQRVSLKMYRMLDEDGSLFINLSSPPSDPLRVYGMLKAIEVCNGFWHLQNTIHWIKAISIGEENYGHYKPVNSKRYLSGMHEYIFHFTKTGAVQLDKDAVGVPYTDKSNASRWKKKKDVRDRGNVWYIPYETRTKADLHPCSFPVLLPEMCIRLHGLTDTLRVLDPFMGTGATGVACRRLGVPTFTGVDISEAYVAAAEEKIRSASKEEFSSQPCI